MGCGPSDTEHESRRPSSVNQSAERNSRVPTQSTLTVESPDEKLVISCNFEEDQQDVKILTLGAGECGKSTLWRQIKKEFCGGFQNQERESMRNTIRESIIEDIKDLIDAMERQSLTIAPKLQPLIESIKDLDPLEDELNEQVANAIAQIWTDPMMKSVYQSANSLGLGENLEYFLDSVERISSSNYVPPDDDILKARIRTVGIASLKFKIQKLKTLLIDVGGQKAERKHWAQCFKKVNYLLFVVSLSDFDQLMFEDKTTKRTEDSLVLFDQMANAPVFQTIPIFLVLNKLDVFKKKIKRSPDAFREAYPGFSGNIENIDECIDHVKKTFLSKLSPGRSSDAWVEVMPITAMEVDSVRTFVHTLARKILEGHN